MTEQQKHYGYLNRLRIIFLVVFFVCVALPFYIGRNNLEFDSDVANFVLGFSCLFLIPGFMIAMFRVVSFEQDTELTWLALRKSIALGVVIAFGLFAFFGVLDWLLPLTINYLAEGAYHNVFATVFYYYNLTVLLLVVLYKE
ncbi:hypothetical protein KQ51_01417 [Candidatus Izimaplasma bacterium HR1]|jgi:hypothetical protein|uniref:hypothetical protein n=1 Tax=Candidatus Izimoplasma sp. HR1 TaxID=1541959 RepID=UPI0004F8CDF6|nr:hypothetical protein KQ51_01417 [Candidatus Izimaplasma bacterium HR1]